MQVQQVSLCPPGGCCGCCLQSVQGTLSSKARQWVCVKGVWDLGDVAWRCLIDRQLPPGGQPSCGQVVARRSPKEEGRAIEHGRPGNACGWHASLSSAWTG